MTMARTIRRAGRKERGKRVGVFRADLARKARISPEFAAPDSANRGFVDVLERTPGHLPAIFRLK